MINKADVEQCRKDMMSCLGRQIRLRSSGGRKRIIVREGILENCYPNVFTVRCIRENDQTELISYSYVDILTETVEVAVKPDPDLLQLVDRSLQNDDFSEALQQQSALPFETDAQINPHDDSL